MSALGRFKKLLFSELNLPVDLPRLKGGISDHVFLEIVSALRGPCSG